MDQSEIRRRVSEARVARIGTVDVDGRPHLVPIVFVLDGDTMYSSTDESPPAKRLKNLERDPRVNVLIDAYDEDWSTIWWVRLRGTAKAISGGFEYERAHELLSEKYPQFEGDPGDGPVIAIDIERWSGWGYRGLGHSVPEK